VAESCAAFLGLSSDGGGSAASEWVSVEDGGSLAYKSLPKGDHILDFSYAGYMGGGVAFPTLPASVTLKPSGGDDTAAIQAAIGKVSALPLNSGARGVVLLGPGTFQLQGSLSIASSGVVLRGSGSGAAGTTLNVTGSARTVLTIGGMGERATTGAAATVTDAYVPSGSVTVHVNDASGLTVGTSVLVGRPVTTAWIAFMGMNDLVRNDAGQTWLKAGTVIETERTVAAVSGNAITFDVPLSDSLDATYVSPPGATVTPYTFAGRIEQVGLESLRIVAPPASTPLNEPTFEMLAMDAVADSWVKDVAAQGFINGMTLGSGALRVTVEGVSFVHTAPIDGDAGYPADFAIDGQLVLLDRCASQGDHVFSVVTEDVDPGPNVVLHMTATGTPTNLAPHQRWATGLLVDGLDSPTGGVDLMNRTTAGSGQGWAIGFGVVWNANAANLLIEQPPGSQNWAIGSAGTVSATSTGAIDSPGTAVGPASLYLAQLCERLGPQAVTNLGY